MTRYRSVVWFGEKHAGDERLGEAQGEAEAIDHGYLHGRIQQGGWGARAPLPPETPLEPPLSPL